MEAGHSSTVLLFLALMLAVASSTTTAAATHRCQPPTGGSGSYMLIAVETSGGDKARLAMRADYSSIAGFANGKNDWFAIQGSEDLMEPLRNRYGGGGGHGIPGHGLVSLLGAMLKKNDTS